ncbi:MAG: hypothetical protein PHW04_02960 [Candidatus Wallbacteria bacterium]|nr:hypothetical protein [Candidatus Wallbacteria bacterium]
MLIYLILSLALLFQTPAMAYIDPGSGSYLFQVTIAALLGGLYAIKLYWQNLKAWFNKKFKRKSDK